MPLESIGICREPPLRPNNCRSTGDFINDYEGIGGYEEFRSDLVLAYFVTLNAGSGILERFEMVSFRTVRFRLQQADRKEARWLHRF